jgi:hypothetical protein
MKQYVTNNKTSLSFSSFPYCLKTIVICINGSYLEDMDPNSIVQMEITAKLLVI